MPAPKRSTRARELQGRVDVRGIGHPSQCPEVDGHGDGPAERAEEHDGARRYPDHALAQDLDAVRPYVDRHERPQEEKECQPEVDEAFPGVAQGAERAREDREEELAFPAATAVGTPKR